jgi:hypothetical protein
LAWPDYEKPPRREAEHIGRAMQRLWRKLAPLWRAVQPVWRAIQPFLPKIFTGRTLLVLLGSIPLGVDLLTGKDDIDLGQKSQVESKAPRTTDAADLETNHNVDRISENAVTQVNVPAGEQLVVRWRNPAHCSSQIKLVINDSAPDNGANASLILKGQAGNRIIKSDTGSVIDLTWEAQIRENSPKSCEDAQGKYMPKQVVVDFFIEKPRNRNAKLPSTPT